MSFVLSGTILFSLLQTSVFICVNFIAHKKQKKKKKGNIYVQDNFFFLRNTVLTFMTKNVGTYNGGIFHDGAFSYLNRNLLFT